MLAKYSVKKPYTVLVAVVLALVLGVVSFFGMTTDLLPELELEVRTSAEILNIREFAGPPDWYGGVN